MKLRCFLITSSPLTSVPSFERKTGEALWELMV